MASTKAPLFSLDASGTIAKSITFSRWKGRPYVRQTVTPANPRSGLQTGMRSVMKFVTQGYAALSATIKGRWQTVADVDNITALNANVRLNQQRARQNLGQVQDPTVLGGTANGAPTSVVATAAPKTVNLTWVNSVTGTVYSTMIHRSLTGTFTPDISNLIAVAQAGTLAYSDTGLTTGTQYFYELRHSNVGGTIGTSAAEVNGTPT